MEVFTITIFMSLAFAVLFTVLCYAERCQRRRRPYEQDALMPLDSGPAALKPVVIRENIQTRAAQNP
ncbi:MAG: hypothetical protein ACO1TE_14740 [Prosthecobacter sp.]